MTLRIERAFRIGGLACAAFALFACDKPGMATSMTDAGSMVSDAATTMAAVEASTMIPDASATVEAGSSSTNLPAFEGELKLNASSKAPEQLDYAMKGDKIRIGLKPANAKGDRGVDVIIDTSGKKAKVLLNDTKQYVDVDLGKMVSKAEARLEAIKVEHTGKTSEVAGRSCEEWKIIDRDYHVLACVAKGGPTFDLTALEQQANFKAPAWLHKVVDAGYVPLRISLTDATGNKLAGTDVVETSSKVDDSRFDVPSDFKKTDATKLTGKKMP
jgi:hypothetical protein